MSGTYGGMQTIGTIIQDQTNNRQEKPTFVTNITKVKGSHTYKAGGEVYFQGTFYTTYAGVTLTTGTGPTMQPYTNTTSLNGYGTGFGYASFLLGDYSSTSQTPQVDYRLGKAQYAFFAQDSWKVTRKLTLDYGLRYDLATAVRETYGRLGQFDPTEVNTQAGNHLGGVRYASNCNCNFYPGAYPYAFGPRLGVAYQIDKKTVFRGGWGVVYQFGDGRGSRRNHQHHGNQYGPWDQQLRQHPVAGLPAATDVARHQSKYLPLHHRHHHRHARYGGCEHVPASAPEPVERGLPAGNHQKSAGGSLLRGQPASLAARVSGPP